VAVAAAWRWQPAWRRLQKCSVSGGSLAAAWRRWAARQKLGGSGGNGGSADASAAVLPPCAVAVVTMTPSQVVKLNLTKINVATVLLLLILLQSIDITEFFFFLDPLYLFVLKILFIFICILVELPTSC
jgi:hypothetical protein